MQSIKRALVLGTVILAVCAGADRAIAQGAGGGPGGGGFGGGGRGFGGGGPGGGGFDMSQMMKMMVDNMQEPLEVTDENEWKVISAQVQKVMELRMKAGAGGMGMFGMMGRRGGMGGGGGGGGMQALFGPDPEGEALQKAIEAKASNAELKGAVDKLVEARKKKQATLETAQADLRKLLSVRQEAIAFSMGLL